MDLQTIKDLFLNGYGIKIAHGVPFGFTKDLTSSSPFVESPNNLYFGTLTYLMNRQDQQSELSLVSPSGFKMYVYGDSPTSTLSDVAFQKLAYRSFGTAKNPTSKILTLKSSHFGFEKQLRLTRTKQKHSLYHPVDGARFTFGNSFVDGVFTQGRQIPLYYRFYVTDPDGTLLAYLTYSNNNQYHLTFAYPGESYGFDLRDNRFYSYQGQVSIADVVTQGSSTSYDLRSFNLPFENYRLISEVSTEGPGLPLSNLSFYFNPDDPKAPYVYNNRGGTGGPLRIGHDATDGVEFRIPFTPSYRRVLTHICDVELDSQGALITDGDLGLFHKTTISNYREVTDLPVDTDHVFNRGYDSNYHHYEAATATWSDDQGQLDLTGDYLDERIQVQFSGWKLTRQ